MLTKANGRWKGSRCPRAPFSLRASIAPLVQDPDIVVIGSGPNGLAASLVLAGLGCKVLVLEANPRRPGGSLGSDELTLPGFTHDVGAGFFPFGKLSPAFLDFDLERHGLEWKNARFESCHPALDGSFACIARDLEESRSRFGTPEDGEAWHELASFYRSVERDLIAALMRPFPALGPAFRVGAPALLRVASLFARSLSATSRDLFRSEAARRVLPSLALHVDVGPGDAFGTGLGFMLGMTATTGGFRHAAPAERSGSRTRWSRCSSTAAVACNSARGERRSSCAKGAPPASCSRVARRSRPGAACSRTAPRRRCSSTCSTAVTSALRREEDAALPARFRHLQARLGALCAGAVARSEQRARARWCTWARASTICRDSCDEIRAFELPDRPYLVLGQHTLADPSRARGKAYPLLLLARPAARRSGWPEASLVFAEPRGAAHRGARSGISRLHPRAFDEGPLELGAQNENLRGGDLGGGTNAWHNQLLFRPVFPYFRYRTPVRGLYLCSSYAHPGAGVHGMCGYNAAQIAARDLL